MNAKTQSSAIAKSIAALDSVCWENGTTDTKEARRLLFEAMLRRGYVFSDPGSTRTRAVTKKDTALWKEHLELVAMKESIVVEVVVGDGCSEEQFTERLRVGVTEQFPKSRFVTDWVACKEAREEWSTNDLISDMREIGWVIEPMDDIKADLEVGA